MATLAPEERVNMSLDDLIKATRKEGGKKTPAKKAGGKGGLKIKTPIAAAASGKKPRRGKKPTEDSAQTQRTKVVVKAATGKAKRNVAMNQRRGIAPSDNTASVQKQIDAAVKKAVNAELLKLQQKANKANNNTKNKGQVLGARGANKPGNKRGGAGPAVKNNRGAGGKAAAPTGLKISFNPKDLNKTTDKTVTAQIKGALSRTVNVSSGRGAPRGRGK